MLYRPTGLMGTKEITDYLSFGKTPKGGGQNGRVSLLLKVRKCWNSIWWFKSCSKFEYRTKSR